MEGNKGFKKQMSPGLQEKTAPPPPIIPTLRNLNMTALVKEGSPGRGSILLGGKPLHPPSHLLGPHNSIYKDRRSPTLSSGHIPNRCRLHHPEERRASLDQKGARDEPYKRKRCLKNFEVQYPTTPWVGVAACMMMIMMDMMVMVMVGMMMMQM